MWSQTATEPPVAHVTMQHRLISSKPATQMLDGPVCRTLHNAGERKDHGCCSQLVLTVRRREATLRQLGGQSDVP